MWKIKVRLRLLVEWKTGASLLRNSLIIKTTLLSSGSQDLELRPDVLSLGIKDNVASNSYRLLEIHK